MKKKKVKGKSEKDMTFTELFKKYPEAAEILLSRGMGCVGCPLASQETFEQGSLVHGIDVEELLKEIKKKRKK